MTPDIGTCPLGRPARQLWSLAEGATFLNHGSFGAVPLVVQAEQERIRRAMEAEPDRFFLDHVVPSDGETSIRAAAAALGRFVGTDGDGIALVENATVGIQAVLQSVSLESGDEILLTDHQYYAVRMAVEVRCRETGAIPRVVAVREPETAEEVTARILSAAGPRTRLAIVDHITSGTALVFPVEQIVAALRAQGVLVLVDGAHGIGQVPLDLPTLGADWYVTNAHKWLFAPRGSALLYSAPRVRSVTRPAIVSHFVAMGFPRSFDYVGTRDYSAALATPAGLAFFRELGGGTRIWSHQARTIDAADAILGRIGARPVGPRAMCRAMRSYRLPQTRAATEDDAVELGRQLWDRERIRVRALEFEGLLLLRISAAAYVDQDDVGQLADALERHGWPSRGND